MQQKKFQRAKFISIDLHMFMEACRWRSGARAHVWPSSLVIRTYKGIALVRSQSFERPHCFFPEECSFLDANVHQVSVFAHFDEWKQHET